MISDKNWHETRLEAEDVAELLGLPRQTVESFLAVIENVILHKFWEEYKKRDRDVDVEDYQVALPYLGDLVISIDNKGKDEAGEDIKSIGIGFAPRKAFYSKVKDVTEGKISPLARYIYKELGSVLKENFEKGKYSDGVEVEFDE